MKITSIHLPVKPLDIVMLSHDPKGLYRVYSTGNRREFLFVSVDSDYWVPGKLTMVSKIVESD